jgi:hypothetical protein
MTMGILRGLVYGAAGALAANRSDPGRQQGPISRPWLPATAAPPPPLAPPYPLTRLGVCGIESLRRDIAVNKAYHVLGEIFDEHGGWPMDLGDRVDVLSAFGPADNVMVLGDHVLMVQSQVEDRSLRLPDLVARVDGLAAAVAQLADKGSRLTAVVCLTDSSEEPRELPGPSGGAVTVTGLDWLAGIARRAVLPGQRVLDELESRDDGQSLRDDLVWSRLEKQLANAVRTSVDLHAVDSSLLPVPGWWVIRRLQLDDGNDEPIELAAVGPTGAFVLQPDRGVRDAAQERAVRGARRLHQYLPWTSCVPVVIDRDATEEGSAFSGSAGPGAGWILRPDRAAEALRRSPTTGVDVRTIAWLNAPIDGWRRTVGGDSSRDVSIRYRV